MKNIIAIAILIVLVALLLVFIQTPPSVPEINSFEDCVKAGYPVMESYPPQCAVPGGSTFTEDSCQDKEGNWVLTISDAKNIAINSECSNRLKETYMCNQDTATYWIDLDIEKEGCNPACVVHLDTREAEINWRCTGLIT